MSYKLHEPALPLRRYIDFIWKAEQSGAASSRRRIYPDGAMALVIHLKEPTATYFVDDKAHSIRVPLIAGPYSRSFQIDPSQSKLVIGVHFRPGAARLFYPVAAHELRDTDVALSDINPTEADCLLNEICSVADERAQFCVVERYLTRKLAFSAAIHPVIDYAIEQFARAGGMRSIRTVQTDTGLSHTRFIQLFREHVGLTPKLFCRIRRFQRLIGSIQRGIPTNWAELALDCGYFDQAHLIHDFRAFAGVTPLAYSHALHATE